MRCRMFLNGFKFGLGFLAAMALFAYSLEAWDYLKKPKDMRQREPKLTRTTKGRKRK